MAKCPYCQKELKYKRSLDRHVAQFHAEAPPAAKPADTSEADHAETPAEVETPLECHSSASAPATMTIKTPPSDENEYYCVDCGAKVRRGELKCSGCGEGLDWSAVKHG